jgi:hypothetical protein
MEQPMADLTGKQIERFCDALVAAFDRSELEQLTRIDLEQNLEAIAGSGKLSVVAFELVTWAQRTGRVSDLLAAAQSRRPTNAALAALAQELGVAPAAKPGVPSSTPGGVSVGKVEAANVALGTQIIDQRGATFYIGGTKIDTGGGAYVGGSVWTRAAVPSWVVMQTCPVTRQCRCAAGQTGGDGGAECISGQRPTGDGAGDGDPGGVGERQGGRRRKAGRGGAGATCRCAGRRGCGAI